MDLATKGISWAENIFHKCEDIYRDGIMAKEPGKIVDVVGEQLRKIYEEITDDLLNPFSFVDESILTDDHGKSMDDKPPSSSSSSLSLSSSSSSSLSSSSSSSSPSSSSSSSLPSSSSSSLPSSSSSSPSSTAFGEQSVVESSGPCRDVFDKNDELTLAGIVSSEVKVNTEEIINALTVKVLQSDVPNSLESKEFRQTHIAFPPEEDEVGNGREEEFDDVGLEDFHERRKHLEELEEADSRELALISQRAMKNNSYKKKLKDMLASNFYSARKKWGSRRGGASGAMIEERSMRGASATAIRGISTRVLSVERPSSSESDWEFV